MQTELQIRRLQSTTLSLPFHGIPIWNSELLRELSGTAAVVSIQVWLYK